MAAETTKTKRKSFEKKVQFTDEASVRPSKKVKTTTTVAENKAEETPAAKARKTRKHAEDFFDDAAEKNGAIEALETVKTKKVKSSKISNGNEATSTVITETELKPIKEKKRKAAVVGEPEKAVKTKKSKTASIGAVAPTSISKSNSNSKETNGMKDKKSKADVKIATPAENTFVSSDDDEDNIADQTAALLAGFDSSSEESEHEDGLALEQVPEAKISKKERKALAAAKNEKPGTIYIGRVPHGFFEHQMRAYFTQFGTILRLRLSRNKKTGASKHYAFIEFESSDVADIVAKTMNNYLMFGHILKVRRIPDEQVHPDLWKGAGKRFKVVPRGRMEARRLNTPKGREYWRMKVEKEGEKRLEKAERLKEMGYVFEMPAVRRVDDVPMRDVDDDDVVVGEKEGTKAITEIAAEDEDPVKEEIDVVAVVPDEAPKAIAEGAAENEDPVEKEIIKVVEQVIEKKDGDMTTSTKETVTEKVKVKKSKKKSARA